MVRLLTLKWLGAHHYGPAVGGVNNRVTCDGGSQAVGR